MCRFEYNLHSFANISYNTGISNMLSFDRINMFKVSVLTFALYSLYAHNFEITNYSVAPKTGVEEPITKEIEQNQLTWYDYVQRMAEGRLPRIALKWMPKQKRTRGRPKRNWMKGIRKAMNERNLNEDQWEDRKQWSLGVGQRRTTFWNLYIYIHSWHQNSKSNFTLRSVLHSLCVAIRIPLS